MSIEIQKKYAINRWQVQQKQVLYKSTPLLRSGDRLQLIYCRARLIARVEAMVQWAVQAVQLTS